MEFEKLLEPFPPQHIEWRVQSCGEKNGNVWAKVLAYVTNRAIMARLDEICGPGNWKNEYAPAPCGGILCGISIRFDGEWVTKWDGAENTDIEAVKGGLSGAMKRAAVQWGIGRYLYDIEEGWANVHDRGRFSGKTKEGKWFKWDPPELPPFALPSGTMPSGATKPAANGRKETGEAATDAQMAFAENLIRSSVFTEDERIAIAKSLASKPTKKHVSTVIQKMQAQIAERENAPEEATV